MSKLARADLAEKQAKVDSDRAGISGAEKQIDVLRARLEQARAPLARRQANERQAELNLGYTTITAPFDGTMGVRNVQVGNFVQLLLRSILFFSLSAHWCAKSRSGISGKRVGRAVSANAMLQISGTGCFPADIDQTALPGRDPGRTSWPTNAGKRFRGC